MGFRVWALLVLLVSCAPPVFLANGVSRITTSFGFDTNSDYRCEIQGQVQDNLSACHLDLSTHVLRLTSSSVPGDFDANSFSAVTGQVQSLHGVGLFLNPTARNDSALAADWTPQWSHLLGYWNLDEASGLVFADSSGNGRPLSQFGGPTSLGVTGQIGNAVAFGIPGQDADLRWSALLPVASTLSFSLWLKHGVISHTQTLQHILAVGDDGTDSGLSFGFQGIGADDSQFEFVLSVANTSVAGNVHITRYNQASDIWHHYVGLYDRGEFRLYEDSILIGQSSLISAPLKLGTVTAVGRSHAGTNLYRSSVDEVALWSVALAPSEIKEIFDRQAAEHTGTYTSPIVDAFNTAAPWTALQWKTPLPFGKPIIGSGEQNETAANYEQLDHSLNDRLEALWHLDEPVAVSDFADSSGHDRTLILVNDSSTTIVAGSGGRFGSGVYFPGSEFGTLEDGLFSSTWSFGALPQDQVQTYAGWFLTTNPHPMGFMGFPDAGDQAQFNVVINGDLDGGEWEDTVAINHRAEQITDAFGAQHTQNYIKRSAAGVHLADGRWHQIVVVLDTSTPSNDATIYVDGVVAQEIDSGHEGSPGAFDYNRPFTVGYADSFSGGTSDTDGGLEWHPFIGLIDEVAIWSRGLSESEVMHLYRRGANRIKLRTRTCETGDCSGVAWSAPIVDSPAHGTLSALNTSGRYFQYRVELESDTRSLDCAYTGSDQPCSPELKSLQVTPTHYDASAPAIQNAKAYSFDKLTGLHETLGTQSCNGGIRYAVSTDGNQYWWFDSANNRWTTSSGNSFNEANAASDLTTDRFKELSSKVAGKQAYFRAFLKSDGLQACELDTLELDGMGYSK